MMLEYNIKHSVWGFHDSDYWDFVYEESYQLEFADVIYYALLSKGKSFKMVFDNIEGLPYKVEGLIKTKRVPKTCEDLICEAKKRQKEAKRYDRSYDRYKYLYKIPEYNIDLLSDFTYRDSSAYYRQPSTIFIPMIEAWKKYFNVLTNITCATSNYKLSCLEIQVNENESDLIYKNSQRIFEFKNEFCNYCLDNHSDLLNKFMQVLKGAEHIAINKYGIYYRCGRYSNLNKKQDIQKGQWLKKTFSSFQQKNLESDAQVLGLSRALMKLLEKDFDILPYFDNGTFLIWISKKKAPVVIQEIPKIESVRLKEW